MKVKNIRYNINDPMTLSSNLFKISNQFLKYFSNHGFDIVEPFGLIPEHDKTVLFTSATITTFRSLLNIKNCKKAVLQPCLRLQNLNKLGDLNCRLNYMSYFNMLGIIDTSTELIRTEEIIIDFLINELQLLDRLVIHVKSDDIKLYSQIIERVNNKITCIYDDPSINFRWTYGGNDNLTGKGIPLCLENKNGSVEEFGQIVYLFRDHKLIGLEFGFGLETFASILYSYRNPFEIHPAWAVLNKHNNFILSCHKFDLMMIFCQLFLLGCKPGKGSYASIIRQVGRRLAALTIKEPPDEVVNDLLYLINSISYKGSVDDFISIWLDIRDRYYGCVKRWYDYKRNQYYLVKLGKIDSDKAHKNLIHYFKGLNLYGVDFYEDLNPLVLTNIG
ncbi:hypothetical protein I7H67_00475 [Acinetobacter sp. ACIN00229]|uniref:alanine--tRNA ligase-related protein n=1 Tax=Acinetobacter sp. ACIN00229 TaxID=2792607 RepID=UPI0018E02B8C|nr:alanine--tRNA ligase-related protein [Acinetobacter sp. ACIN00229]MBI0421282.1 hypothetical protein [Acinetobacter sp. ACIN00229]